MAFPTIQYAEDDKHLPAVVSSCISAEVRLSNNETSITGFSAADVSLTTRVSTEECTRSTGDSTLICADASLTTRVSTEECALSTEKCTRSTGDSTLICADASLTTRVSTEECNRSTGDSTLICADASLTTRVSTEECALSTEKCTRSTGDSTLICADASLTTRVSTEECNRSTGDSTLICADASLTTRVSTDECGLSTEKCDRSTGDSTLICADASLTTRVSTEECSRSTGDSTLICADASLTTRVSTEECTRATAVTSVNTRVSDEAICFSLYAFREVDANSDVGNLAAHGGQLASDSTPALAGGANEAQQISWVAGNTDIVCYSTSLPEDFDGAQDATLEMWVSSGAVGPDPATFTIESGWDGGVLVADAAGDGSPGAAVHKITCTIAAADIPNDPSYLMIDFTPAGHANDPITIHAVRLLYKRTA